jgi:hypothetical protein
MVREKNLSTAETMETLLLLAVEEFKAPREQAYIDARNKLVIPLFTVLLSYFKPKDAIQAITELAITIVNNSPEIKENLKVLNKYKEGYVC